MQGAYRVPQNVDAGRTWPELRKKVPSRACFGGGSATSYSQMNAFGEGGTLVYLRVHDGVRRLYLRELATSGATIMLRWTRSMSLTMASTTSLPTSMVCGTRGSPLWLGSTISGWPRVGTLFSAGADGTPCSRTQGRLRRSGGRRVATGCPLLLKEAKIRRPGR